MEGWGPVVGFGFPIFPSTPKYAKSSLKQSTGDEIKLIYYRFMCKICR